MSRTVPDPPQLSIGLRPDLSFDEALGYATQHLKSAIYSSTTLGDSTTDVILQMELACALLQRGIALKRKAIDVGA